MRVKLPAFLVLIVVEILFHSSCTPAKNQTTPENKLPGTMAITPSSFRCAGTVMESNSQSVRFVVTKIIERGSSLFYPVSAGDTLTAIFQSRKKNNFSAGTPVELLIEERLKMNSEIPEFIVRSIQSQ